MAIKQLTPEQVQTMSLEEKDKWWLENVYRGEMPQLTCRSGLTSFLLGGALSLTNLYIGARTSWSLGVGVTSVILSFVPAPARKPWYVIGDDNHGTTCAGVIAGGALTGVVVTVIETFFLAPGK